ncbi:olfactory receptor 2A5-like [Sagmatias obliquidens]|uniref:olfactory receptor 2A5-like n=1 Tax=Sagmatias obliquidens TaxID=3371155 RepID=UPI000F44654B|nr:olfactory receptor 2A5-like [Lagenorhynchus obliquidens]
MHCFLSIPCHSRAFPKTQHDQSQGSARFLPPGFSVVPEIQLLSAAAFLLVYPAAFLGNISIVAAVTLDARLHTPMYSFLKHLSLVDICSVSTTLPRALVATLLGSGQISLHAPNVIDHFCDIPPLMRLACANTGVHDTAGFAASGCVIISCFSLTVLSCVRILAMVVQICSAASPWKAFSRCSSHLATVLLFYGTGSSAYMQPTARYSPQQGRLAAVFYCILMPTLNPLIYSLKNKDMKGSLRKLYLQVPP